MDRGAWLAIVHGITKSQTGLKQLSMHTHAQLCLTLWDPMDCSQPGSPVHGIFPARILGWVAISCSRDPSDPGIKHMSLCLLHWEVDSFTTEPPGKPSDIWAETWMLRRKPVIMLRSLERIFQERGQYEEQSPETASVNSFPSCAHAPPTIQRQCSFPSLVGTEMCAFQVALIVKSPPASARDSSPTPGSVLWRRKWPTSIFLPGESHGQRSLVGYHP